MFKDMKKQYFRPGNGKKVGIIFAISFTLLVVLGFLSYEATKASVTLALDGEEKVVRSHADNVSELLEENGIKWRKSDILIPSGDTKVFHNMNITYKPAKEVTIVMNGEEKTIFSTAVNIADMIKEQGIELKEHDQVVPNLKEDLANHLTVSIEKAFEIVYFNGNDQQKAWTTSTTVADFLKQHEITLDELDRVEPAEDANITPDTVVKVIQVEKVTDVVEEAVDYAVVTQKDSSLKKGSEKVVEPGEKGKVEKHYEVVLENGKEISRTLVKTETVKESKDRVVAVGTKVVQAPVSRSTGYTNTNTGTSGSGNVVREFYVSSTAYTAYCTGCSGVTATGINLRANPNMKVIAVDPRVIPLGTRVYVDGYGYAIAADTGGAIKGNKIDVFFPTKEQAYRWGRKTVRIKILN